MRHFIVHTRRAGYVVARPLNCGVMRQLERHRVRCAWLPAVASLLVFFAALSGCSDNEVELGPLASESCYRPPLDAVRMQRELENRDVIVSRDGDCLTFAATSEVVCSAELSAFGEPPPSGLNIRRASEAASETVRRLAESGVTARVMTYAGMDYVAWDAADAERAEEALNIRAEQREAMRRMRANEAPCAARADVP